MLERHEWLVAGMDCQACGIKVKGTLTKTPGIESVEFFPLAQRLRVEFDRTLVTPEAIEGTVKGLGYETTRGGIDRKAAVDDPAPTAAGTKTPWYRTGKGLLVVLTTALLALAWGAALSCPRVLVDGLSSWPALPVYCPLRNGHGLLCDRGNPSRSKP